MKTLNDYFDEMTKLPSYPQDMQVEIKAIHNEFCEFLPRARDNVDNVVSAHWDWEEHTYASNQLNVLFTMIREVKYRDINNRLDGLYDSMLDGVRPLDCKLAASCMSQLKKEKKANRIKKSNESNKFKVRA